MRAVLWVAVLALSVMAAPIARAQDIVVQDNGAAVFSAFRDVCIGGGGSADHALNKLRAQGWTPAPEELQKSMQQETGPGISVLLNFDVETLEMKTASAIGPTIALAGMAPADMFEGLPVAGPLCGLMPLQGTGAAVHDTANAFFGFEPFAHEEGGAFWIYTQSRGVMTEAAGLDALDDEAFLELVRMQPYYVFGIIETDGLMLLLFMRLEG